MLFLDDMSRSGIRLFRQDLPCPAPSLIVSAHKLESHWQLSELRSVNGPSSANIGHLISRSSHKSFVSVFAYCFIVNESVKFSTPWKRGACSSLRSSIVRLCLSLGSQTISILVIGGSMKVVSFFLFLLLSMLLVMGPANAVEKAKSPVATSEPMLSPSSAVGGKINASGHRTSSVCRICRAKQDKTRFCCESYGSLRG